MPSEHLFSELNFHVVSGNEITESLSNKIAELRCEVFGNIFPYIINPKTGESFTAGEVLHSNRDTYAVFEEMEEYQKGNHLEGNDFIFYRDIERTRELIKEQLMEKQGFVSYVEKEGEIVGGMYGYKGDNFRSASAYEWEDRFKYSNSRDYKRDLSAFFETKKLNLKINNQNPVLVYNFCGYKPEIRGMKITPKIGLNFFNQVQSKLNDDVSLVISDVERGNPMHRFLSKSNGIEFSQVMNSEKENLNEVVILTPLEGIFQNLKIA